MNKKYVLIVVCLAGLVGGWALWFSGAMDDSWTAVSVPDAGSASEDQAGRDSVLEKIQRGKEFLLRMEDEETHGFHKYYYASEDEFENRLHTVYSASIIYTLLKVYDFDGDQEISEKVSGWGEFLLSMQSQEGKSEGAFHYSYYPESGEKEQRFVVGTAALSVFTLLDLYERTGEEKYLESAEMAGDWLVGMRQDSGIMKPYQRYEDGSWYYGTKESLLYNGQVLSALSRLYGVTGEERYKSCAEGIAGHLEKRVEEDGCFLGDEYRSPNPISSAWVVMSLLDFYKVMPEEKYREIISGCSRELAERQMTETSDPLYFGRWNLSFSTSGNGWLAEVMMEMYHFCREEGLSECEDYRTALVNVIAWLDQFTYSEENASGLANPRRALGGICWDYDDEYVRTDSVCHALNGYVGIADFLEE